MDSGAENDYQVQTEDAERGDIAVLHQRSVKPCHVLFVLLGDCDLHGGIICEEVNTGLFRCERASPHEILNAKR